MQCWRQGTRNKGRPKDVGTSEAGQIWTGSQSFQIIVPLPPEVLRGLGRPWELVDCALENKFCPSHSVAFP